MVNIEQLSAKELYELAKKKEQEEARLAQLQQQVSELKTKRQQLIKQHQEELACTDRKITELTEQRQEMLLSHQKALSLLDDELKRVRDECEVKAAASTQPDSPSSREVHQQAANTPGEKPLVKEELPPPVPNPGTGQEKTKRKPQGDEEELEQLMEHIQKMMKGRSYISDSLLREKLQVANFKPANLTKLLDTLLRQARLVRRSGDNYVLGKISKKK